jgi:hypothetical protein
MRYEIGDYVYPTDLPRRVTCRVLEVDRMAVQGGEVIQILTLAPLEGPWRPGTELVRLDGAVAPARPGRPARVVPLAQAARRRERLARARDDGRVRLRVASLPIAFPRDVGDA